ncbi:hypothetical protein DTO013E5_4753 [Penicillium roqueforti]|uniref:Genomic scaffold, ProqFM164S01 n=1 Tax=Penicillium roqueforti (strain FM164) TaxID=1365484 RepID=W6PQQ1_PENRF|nr:uncharacterized protein LCP9604111_6216 [Penicillium roqueforti]CDM26523.1 unnamed protein product [Penicillium roqueforti FM164]KAF9247517.1 hypothetical protein LCP9604111_6216 [Penicillium roqueforti]KAI1834857.1 hypothetical protein CBS147337_4411 [Penicillium roqueforti]KAI2676700.1 hypothetical protein CBS147355_5802 [Penicillium roqueforti]KAI2683575.1 hypothetical protein LCP963914a_5976 [Penicillium roqueforti]
MKPSPLDMGYARPLEFTLSIVVRTSPSPLDFQFAADTLVSQWPVLNLRMDPLKTKFLDPKDPGDLAEVWKGKILKQELSEILQVSPKPDSPQLIDSEAFDKALDFGYGVLHAWRQRVFSIRTVFLTDACIIGFKFLQPLCDANGAHQIVQAYCSLLRGEKITHSLHARPLLPLKTEVIEKCVEKIECHRIADLHKYSMNRTWIAGITALGKQIGRNICYPSARRIGKTLLVPRGQIQRWIEAAESKQAKVTEHDLLLAFIYKASLHLHTAHNFGLTIDISKQLQSEANLSNPWYMMPLPDPIPTSEYDSPSLVRLATHIRRAVHEGQQSECIAEIIAQHKNPTKRPMVPKSYGSRAAQPRIASWKSLPLYGLDIEGECPLFVQGSVDYCGLLRQTKTHLDDLVVTWKGRGQDGNDGGYWIHGRLPKSVWRRMADDLNC